jgi:MYXO-CTERM domain-containing protein
MSLTGSEVWMASSGNRFETEEIREEIKVKKRFMLTAAGATAAAIVGAANADITVNIDTTTLLGGEQVFVDLGAVSGTLTGISYSYSWTNDTGDSSWSSDMLLAVSNSGNFVSVGGYNLSYGGSSWGALSGGPASGSYSGIASGSAAMSGNAGFYWANGWSSSAGTTSSGTFTLMGINAIPAPGALALLGLAGLAGRRRRRA